MHVPWYLKRWVESRRQNNHFQRDIKPVDGQLMDGVVPAFPDPVEDVPLEIQMQCFDLEAWQGLIKHPDCPQP